jgi:hypothetical protein
VKVSGDAELARRLQQLASGLITLKGDAGMAGILPARASASPHVD